MAMQLGINAVLRKGLLSSPSSTKTLIQRMSLTKNATKVLPAKGPSNDLHVSSRSSYPAAKPLPLPDNVDESELACFSPQRSRDISGSVISHRTEGVTAASSDPHVASYDCRGALSLSSAMQSNVPEPFASGGKCTHLNMPGGQWAQGHKYIAADMQDIHYARVPRGPTQGTAARSPLPPLPPAYAPTPGGARAYCTSANKGGGLSRADKLRRAVKEYGVTVVVFHVGISLLSLGGCYLAVTSGVNMGGVLNWLGPGSEVAAEAGQFVVAYGVHKILAPVRITITLASAPFIVRYLRKIGFLKVPKPGV